MKSTILAFATVFSAISISAQSYPVKPEMSAVKWHAEKVTGEHDGEIKIKSGKIEMKDGKFTGGNFTIDMPTITNTDLKDPEYNAKLVNHLKSEDFFSVEKHPESKLVTKKVIHQGKNRYKVEGDITIKGITKPIKFNAFVDSKDDKVSGYAEITIDRSEFNVQYGSGSFFDNLGDKTIYDEFTLNVSIVATK